MEIVLINCGWLLLRHKRVANLSHSSKGMRRAVGSTDFVGMDWDGFQSIRKERLENCESRRLNAYNAMPVNCIKD